jgi:hypothetical protein
MTERSLRMNIAWMGEGVKGFDVIAVSEERPGSLSIKMAESGIVDSKY